jgi:hypothetical protein
LTVVFNSSRWYPDVDFEHLYTGGIFSYWIFAVDDLMDANDESLSLDLAASTRYREQTIKFCRYWLGLDPLHPQHEKPPPLSKTKTNITSRLLSWLLPSPIAKRKSVPKAEPEPEPEAPNLPTGVFKEFGQRVARHHSIDFREGLAKEIQDYLDHCGIEQRERLTGETSPDVDSYLRIRYYTSAVRLYCYITQCVPPATNSPTLDSKRGNKGLAHSHCLGSATALRSPNGCRSLQR